MFYVYAARSNILMNIVFRVQDVCTRFLDWIFYEASGNTKFMHSGSFFIAATVYLTLQLHSISSLHARFL